MKRVYSSIDGIADAMIADSYRDEEANYIDNATIETLRDTLTASESTVAALRSEVERLTRERDEAEHYSSEWKRVCGDWQQSSFENSQRATASESEVERLTKALEPPKGWNPTHRHVKRGSSYQIVAHARLQTERPLEDNRDVIVYEGEDGAVWVRPYHEFHDGRFEKIAARAIDRSPSVESGK